MTIVSVSVVTVVTSVVGTAEVSSDISADGIIGSTDGSIDISGVEDVVKNRLPSEEAI